jgi:hypothetical protein
MVIMNGKFDDVLWLTNPETSALRVDVEENKRVESKLNRTNKAEFARYKEVWGGVFQNQLAIDAKLKGEEFDIPKVIEELAKSEAFARSIYINSFSSNWVDKFGRVPIEMQLFKRNESRLQYAVIKKIKGMDPIPVSILETAIQNGQLDIAIACLERRDKLDRAVNLVELMSTVMASAQQTEKDLSYWSRIEGGLDGVLRVLGDHRTAPPQTGYPEKLSILRCKKAELPLLAEDAMHRRYQYDTPYHAALIKYMTPAEVQAYLSKSDISRSAHYYVVRAVEKGLISRDMQIDLVLPYFGTRVKSVGEVSEVVKRHISFMGRRYNDMQAILDSFNGFSVRIREMIESGRPIVTKELKMISDTVVPVAHEVLTATGEVVAPVAKHTAETLLILIDKAILAVINLAINQLKEKENRARDTERAKALADGHVHIPVATPQVPSAAEVAMQSSITSVAPVDVVTIHASTTSLGVARDEEPSVLVSKEVEIARKVKLLGDEVLENIAASEGRDMNLSMKAKQKMLDHDLIDRDLFDKLKRFSEINEQERGLIEKIVKQCVLESINREVIQHFEEKEMQQGRKERRER